MAIRRKVISLRVDMLIEVAALAVEPYVWINRLETRAPAPAFARR